MVHPIAEANEVSPFGSLTPDEFYSHHSVSHSSEYIINPRGLKLFTQWWTPLPPTEITGIVAVVHGFTNESSWLVQLTSVYIAKSGFAVCAIDHQGHGFSNGLKAHIPDVNSVLDDCMSFFDSFRVRYPISLPSFLYSESLGGSIALLITLRSDNNCKPYNGVILNGAMYGISDKFKPPWPLERLLPIATTLIPTWKVIPTRGSLPDVSFKVDWKRKLVLANPRQAVDRLRPTTVQELLRICRELQERFGEIDVPLLIVHGGGDVVCDPALAEELYRSAASEDKTLKLYPGMWHQLIGEPDEIVELVFGEMVEWLKARTASGATKAATVDGGA